MAAAASSSISDNSLLALTSHGRRFSFLRHQLNISLSFTQKSTSVSSLKVQSKRGIPSHHVIELKLYSSVLILIVLFLLQRMDSG